MVALIDALDHPGKPVIHALRALVLDCAPEVKEEVKWKSPSFFTVTHFATMNLRAGRVWLILHTGARPRVRSAVSVSDTSGLLEWLGEDRAVVKIADLADLDAKRAPLTALLRGWIQAL